VKARLFRKHVVLIMALAPSRIASSSSIDPRGSRARARKVESRRGVRDEL
jgi:hypothetical protein